MKTFTTQALAMIDRARAARVHTGFGRLNRDGQLTPGSAVELWITARMTHVFALATLLAIPGARDLATHGINCLARYQHDPENGGYFSAIAPIPNAQNQGQPTPSGKTKEAYAHAFVVLAASSGVCAEIPGASTLLEDALAVTETHWWEPDVGRVREAFDAAFTTTEEYRGVNANMHTTEAFLAAYDATGERKWLDRAVGILDWVLNQQARTHDWFIPEHFDAHWQELPDYNRENPAHPFRPWGYTIGHSFEWARLCLHAYAALQQLDDAAPEWMPRVAGHVINAAIRHGWAVDGRPGFVYTIGTDLRPVVRERMHWVPCEAIGAAAVASRFNDEDVCGVDLRPQLLEWWSYCQRDFIAAPGLWWHELDPENQPGERTWPDKPDAYHVVQAMLLPGLGAAPCFAGALRALRTGLNT